MHCKLCNDQLLISLLASDASMPLSKLLFYQYYLVTFCFTSLPRLSGLDVMLVRCLTGSVDLLAWSGESTD